jgi:hypothetical protein
MAAMANGRGPPHGRNARYYTARCPPVDCTAHRPPRCPARRLVAVALLGLFVTVQQAKLPSFDGSAIAYNLRHLDGDAQAFPLCHLRGGPDPIGILAPAVAALAALAAWVLARPSPAAPTPGRSPPPVAAEPPARSPARTGDGENPQLTGLTSRRGGRW